MNAWSTRLVTLLLGLGAATACTSAPQSELDTASSSWNSQHPHAYSFVSTESCNCLSDVTRPIRVTVTTGITAEAIQSAVYADDEAPISEDARSRLRTIDGVFEEIQDAIDEDAAEVRVDYDETMGYPISVFVDYDRNAADEELSLSMGSAIAVESA